MNDIHVYFIWTYENQILHNYYYQIITYEVCDEALSDVTIFDNNLSQKYITTFEEGEKWTKSYPLSLLEICHFATVLCNWFSVASDTCNWKFTQLPKTSCIKITVASDSPYMTSIYDWVIRFHPPILYTSNWKCDCMQLQGLRSHSLHVN